MMTTKFKCTQCLQGPTRDVEEGGNITCECGARMTRVIDRSSALDVQVGGDHYKDQTIQPVQYIEANEIQFLEGCSIKRLTRHNHPHGKGAEDIRKVIHECELLLELRYGEKP